MEDMAKAGGPNPGGQGHPVGGTKDSSENGKGKEENAKARRWPLWVLLVLTITGGGYGIHRYIYSLSHEWTDDAFIDGTIVRISPRVSGHVAKVHVKANQRVEQGDLLIEIDPQPFEARALQAQAALEVALAAQKAAHTKADLARVSANAQLDESRAGVKVSEAGLEAARNRVEQARAQLDAARADVEQEKENASAAEAVAKRAASDLQRYQELRRKEVISEQELDAATAEASSSSASREAARRKVASVMADQADAEASVRAAEQALQEAESRLTQAKAQLSDAESAPQKIASSEAMAAEADARVDQARAVLRQAELDLSYARITAPSGGHVTRKSVEAGDYVATGQALFALVTPDTFVTANFKETQLTKMRPGQSVTIKIDAYPDQIFKGHVESIQRGSGARFSLLPPENATGNYVKVVQRVPVKIVFDGDPGGDFLLGPGMSVVPTVAVK